MPKFSDENLQIIRTRFNKKAQDDYLLLDGFRQVWNSIFTLDLLIPTESNTRLAKLVYNIFDYDGDGKVGWEEFVRTVAYLCSGRLRDRLRFGFAVFDISKQGSIQRQYFPNVLSCCMDALYEQTDQEQREALIDEFTKLVYENYALNDPSSLTLAEYKEAAVGNQIVCYIFTLGIESELVTVDGTQGISFQTPAISTPTTPATPATPASTKQTASSSLQPAQQPRSDAAAPRSAANSSNPADAATAQSRVAKGKETPSAPPAFAPDKRRMSRMIAPGVDVVRNHKSGHIVEDGIDRARLEIIVLRNQLDEEQSARQRLEAENSKLRAEVDALKKKLVEAKKAAASRADAGPNSVSSPELTRVPTLSKGAFDQSITLEDPTVIKASWMTKRGNLVRSWRRRYFVLGFDNHIRYYEFPNDVAEKGFINLNMASAVFQSTATDAPGFAIDIVTPDRIYTLSCESKDLYGEWLATIRGIIKRKQDGN